jgi:HNH endonuclease
MKHYQGQTKDDRLRGGGSYVEDKQTGHEVCNFANAGGSLYGYVQVGKERDGHYQEGSINFERLGVPTGQEVIKGGTVIWTATDPSERRRKVVGWYENASIFQRYQRFAKPPTLHKRNGISGYWISAPINNCVLLSQGERTFNVPRMKSGFPGISPIWYADSPESVQFVSETLSFISSYGDSGPLQAADILQAAQLAQLSASLEDRTYFAATSQADERTRLLREVVQRRGQAQFRRQLLQAYAGRCAVTGCDAVDALEAAHIIGYIGLATQHVRNGLLLRADIHTLFDLGLLSICPDTLSVVLTPSLRSSSYASLHGQPLALPVDQDKCPDIEALRQRWREIPSV